MESTISTTQGQLRIETSEDGIRRISFTEEPSSAEPAELAVEAGRQIDQYLAAERSEFELPIDRSLLSPFQARMFAALAATESGKSTTYGALAALLGHRGARAIGQALGANPLPLLLPCHRVLASDGGLGGYAGGLDWKRALLAAESR